MKPCVDIVWGFEILHICATVGSKEFADCRVDGEFVSKDRTCFVLPFFESSVFGTVRLGNGEEFGDSEDSIRIEGEGVLALLK